MPETKKRPIPKAIGYGMIYPFLALRARKCGYALAVHGSLGRDLDLVAVPWTEEATTAEDLVAELMRHTESSLMPNSTGDGAHGRKPHGRRCWSIHLTGWVGMYIDLSVMPRSPDA